MPRTWDPEQVSELSRSYQAVCVLAAAADHDVFTHLDHQPASADELAARIQADPRGTTVLLDALVALELLVKTGARYSVPVDVAELLSARHRNGLLPMVQHQANCLRRWARLPWVVQSGKPADDEVSVRGPQADREAFIEAMHCHSKPLAPVLIKALGPLRLSHLLDIGGATGTWTAAFLRAAPAARATIFDLPDAIPLARRRMQEEGLADRVQLVAGDFYVDALPGGADLAWLGAIVHQNSRPENRALFSKVHAALAPEGEVVIRDVIMNDSHTRPVGGALFAINMLVATPLGGTFSFAELREDLEATGFCDVELVRQGQFMDSLVRAKRAPSAGR